MKKNILCIYAGHSNPPLKLNKKLKKEIPSKTIDHDYMYVIIKTQQTRLTSP